jgi:hypothetical protein
VWNVAPVPNTGDFKIDCMGRGKVHAFAGATLRRRESHLRIDLNHNAASAFAQSDAARMSIPQGSSFVLAGAGGVAVMVGIVGMPSHERD